LIFPTKLRSCLMYNRSSVQYEQFVQRMQSDVQKRQERTEMAKERLTLVNVEPETTQLHQPQLSDGTVSILKKNGSLNWTPAQRIERMHHMRKAFLKDMVGSFLE